MASEKSEAITEQNFELAATLRDKEKELRDEYDKMRADWERRKNSEELSLSESDVADIVTQWTQIPVSRLLESDAERLGGLKERLASRVIGQESAVAAVSSAILRGRTGLGDPKRPIGSFIFAGQTGVGKTELCRALASALFGSDDAMIRLDMSEYMEKQETTSRRLFSGKEAVIIFIPTLSIMVYPVVPVAAIRIPVRPFFTESSFSSGERFLSPLENAIKTHPAKIISIPATAAAERLFPIPSTAVTAMVRNTGRARAMG